MSQSVAIPVVARFDPEVGPERRRELFSRLADAELSARTGLDLGELVSVPSVIRPAAVVAFVDSVADVGRKVVKQTAEAALGWLAESQREPGQTVEIELPNGVVFRIRANTTEAAISMMAEAWHTVGADEPVEWSGDGWAAPARAGAAPKATVAGPPARRPGALRVLALDTDWSSAKGGISTVNRHLCAALAALGAEVHCVVLRATREEIEQAAASGITVLIAQPVPGRPEESALSRRPRLPDGVVPDVVIGHGRVTGPEAWQLAEEHYPRAQRVHMVHTIPDEIEWEKPETRHEAGERAELRTLDELSLSKTATLAVGIGPRIHALLQRQQTTFVSRTPPHRCDPGFDLDPRTAPNVAPGGGPVQVLIQGRLRDHGVKGLDITAQALAEAVDLLDGMEVEFVLRGVPDGTHTRFYDQVREWSKHSVRVTPRRFTTEPGELRDELKQTTLVVMPSRAESFGLVGVETIVAGTPILVSANSGLGMLLDEVLDRPAYLRTVVEVSADEAQNRRRWGHAIAAVLRDPAAAFTHAAAVRETMSAARTWAMAAESLLAALDRTP
jgi:glycosyltransferase involved in cell wall biosynthesis